MSLGSVLPCSESMSVVHESLDEAIKLRDTRQEHILPE
jgi:hypothetical protein